MRFCHKEIIIYLSALTHITEIIPWLEYNQAVYQQVCHEVKPNSTSFHHLVLLCLVFGELSKDVTVFTGISGLVKR